MRIRFRGPAVPVVPTRGRECSSARAQTSFEFRCITSSTFGPSPAARGRRVSFNDVARWSCVRSRRAPACPARCLRSVAGTTDTSILPVQKRTPGQATRRFAAWPVSRSGRNGLAGIPLLPSINHSGRARHDRAVLETSWHLRRFDAPPGQAVRLLPTLFRAVVTFGKKASPNRRTSAHAADPVRYDY